MRIVIASDSSIPIEQNFRISAGPGAGKTHWLVNHIKNVITKSTRLGKAKKIACITYTNVASETILERLKGADDKVEVSTIHSFLYKNIIKPFIYFISTDFELDPNKIDGHDDTILSGYKFLEEWKAKTRQGRIRNDSQVVDAFASARWKFDNSGNLVIRPDYPRNVDGYAISNSSYFEYKKMSWAKGVLHHDDVLFFSYQLLIRFPFIKHILRTKFPYFYLDEFQDTNPIQTKIVEWIGESETIVGIIGDTGQSIYGFQGASPDHFSSIRLSDLVDYTILDNRRSTNAIIYFLNNLRPDLVQNGIRNIQSESVKILVGNKADAYHTCLEMRNNESVAVLSRNNIITNSMKRLVSANIPNHDLQGLLKETDHNYDRQKIIIRSIKAIELARDNNFKDAIKEISKIFRKESNLVKSKKMAFSLLHKLLTSFDAYKNGSLLEFRAHLANNCGLNIAKLIAGATKTFYEGYSYEQMSVFVINVNDKSPFRTIHKSKGAEFDAVHLVLENESDLDFILNPDLNNEEHRIYYVGTSRARDYLFINVPTLSHEKQIVLENKNIEVITL